MSEPALEAKRLNAIDAHCVLIAFLRAHQLHELVSRFEAILDALKRADYDQAISLDAQLPRTGEDSVANIFVPPHPGEDSRISQSNLTFLLGAQKKCVANIRVLRTCNLNHPLVQLSLDGLDAATRVTLIQKLP
jgi:hypothetical protein